MNLNIKQSTKKLVSTVAMASAFMSFPAYSLQMTASNTWSINGGPVTSDIDGPASSGAVDVLGGGSNTNGNVFYHTFGNSNGIFGSRSSGEGNYNIEGLYTFNENYIATGGQATFDFSVIPGEITVFGNLIAGESLFAGYSLEIFLNGGSIWDSSATIDKTIGGTSFAETGTNSLNGSLVGDSYSWNTFNNSLNLGSFIAGTSINISYTLRTQAAGITSTANCFSNGGGDGLPALNAVPVDGIIVGPFQQGGQCGSIARIGDPNGLNQGNTTTITGAVPDTAVPEPASIVLLGLGLIGVSLSKKRKQA